MCPICESEECQELVRKYNDEYGEYELRRCTTCQEVYTVVISHTELAKQRWPGYVGGKGDR